LPATNLPTSGVATYNMIGYSASCTGNSGCTGVQVNSSSLSVNFGTSTVALSKALSVIGGSQAGQYTFSSSTGVLAGAQIQNISGSLVGPGGSGGFEAMGFLSGSGASHAGLGWSGYVSGGPPTYPYTYLNGVTAYKK
jgi:hypothetical protein